MFDGGRAEIMRVLERFGDGKKQLKSIRSKKGGSHHRGVLEAIGRQIEANGELKAEFEALLGEIRIIFRDNLSRLDDDEDDSLWS
jgi:hypothetical protein